MATAPSVTIGLSNTQVTVGDPIETTVSYYTGPRSSQANPNVHLYGSVNGQAKEIRRLYGSVNGQTKEIKKLYGSVNGQAKRIL